MAATANVALSGLARALIQHGRLSEADAIACSQGKSESANAFLLELASRGLLGTREAARFAAETFGYPLLDVGAIDKGMVPRDIVDRKLMSKHQVVGLTKRHNRVTLAVADPSNMRALDEIRFQTGLQQEGASPDAEEEASEVDDAPIVRFIQKVLIDAINEGASDIHFEPYEKFYRIRVRTDGILREIAQPPLVLKEKIAARIKVISRLDISERRVPQDGRMKLVLSKNKTIDFRVSTLPTLFGEKIVMRILDSSGIKLGIEALGYEPDQQQALLFAVGRPYGMILVTGPTGSGKTVSLYTCLSILNQPGVNIATAEDPAEIMLPGVNQVNVNEKAGLTFATALRAFLRQDPDVIMVGEIRDLETADIAIKAAQTGHLVLSTLHTNDAPTTLTRLLKMGVPPFNVASSVILITAQRLARRLCENCKTPADYPREALLKAGFTAQDLASGWK